MENTHAISRLPGIHHSFSCTLEKSWVHLNLYYMYHIINAVTQSSLSGLRKQSRSMRLCTLWTQAAKSMIFLVKQIFLRLLIMPLPV